jgi:hypothetical protein
MQGFISSLVYNGVNCSLTNQLTLWEDIGDIQIDDLYTISTLAWKPDGR